MKKIKYIVSAFFVALLCASNADATAIKGLFSKGLDTVSVDNKNYNVEEIYQKMMQIVGKISENTAKIKDMISTAKLDASNVKKNLESIYSKRKQSLRTNNKMEQSEAMLNIITLLAMPNSWVDEHIKFGRNKGYSYDYEDVQNTLVELREMLPEPTKSMWSAVQNYLMNNKDITLTYGQNKFDWWRVQNSWFAK